MNKNMKKTVFEGVINGEKFDNVVDYNKRLTSLLGSGAKVDAQANTKTVEENEKFSGEDAEDKYECHCGAYEHCNCQDFDLDEYLDEFDLTSKDLIPGFNDDTYDFISDIFSNLNSVDRETLDAIDLDALSKTLSNKDYLSDLCSAIDHVVSNEDGMNWLNDYLTDLTDIYHTLETSVAKEQINYAKNTEKYAQACKDVQKYGDQIAELQQKIVELKKLLNDAKDAGNAANDYTYKYSKYIQLAKIFRKFYSPLYHKVKDKLNPVKINSEQANPKVEVKEKKPQQEVNYATGLGGDNPEELQKKIKEVSDMLGDTLKSLGLDISNVTVPSPENAANLFRDIFGKGVADEFLNAIKKKKNK